MPAPTLSLTTVRAAVKAKVAGVAGMGSTFDHEPYFKEANKLASLYVNTAQTGSRLYGWFVSLRAVRETYLDIGRWIADANWRLVAYMSVDEADNTELKLEAQIGLVRDAFRDDDALGAIVANGVTLTIDNSDLPVRGVQVDDIDHVLFAGVLCHRARCSLTTRIYF